MRNSFTFYSKYYDSLYKNKNYLKEVNHYLNISKKHKSKKIKNIVDIGCGTGVHSFLLAKKSYNLLGIDKSQNMLNIAVSKKKKISNKLKINFKKLDILKQEVEFEKKFDAIFLFFHVFSYFLSNKDYFMRKYKGIDRFIVHEEFNYNTFNTNMIQSYKYQPDKIAPITTYEELDYGTYFTKKS